MYSIYNDLPIEEVEQGRDVDEFNPYTHNGGSVVAIAGSDYAVIASDTRLVTGMSICSRNQTKLFRLTKRAVLGCAGCWCDTLGLARVMVARLEMYSYENLKAMPTPAISQMLSTMLYYKRFFPYFVYNVLAGLDDEGRGCVYGYDPLGHCERTQFKACGSALELLQPLLDNQVGSKNMQLVGSTPFTQDMAVNIIKDVFTSATEREINTGDNIHINLINKDGVQEEWFKLRRD